MGAGRKSLLKISEKDFVEYLLDKLVDEKGNKVAVREVWSNPEFMEYTGFRHIKNKDKPVSTGTMRYHQNVKMFDIPVLTEKYGRKYTMCETTLYKYHKEVTGKILSSTPFNTFSREKNSGYHRVVRNEGEITNEKILRQVGNELGFILTIEDMGGNLTDYRDYLIFKYGEDTFDDVRESVVSELG